MDANEKLFGNQWFQIYARQSKKNTRQRPRIIISQPANLEDYFTPAQSIDVNGVTIIQEIRDACDFALSEEEKNNAYPSYITV